MTEAAEEKKSTWRGWLGLAFVFIGLPVGGLALLWKDRCHESARGLWPSPSAAFSAEATVKECGTRLKPATVLRLRAGSEPGAEEVLILQGDAALDVRWDAPETLSVGLPKDAVVVKKRTDWRGLAVVFR